jgi:type II secretory pathway pseudopilin PulG
VTRPGVGTKKNHLAVVFFRVQEITSWLAQQLREQQQERKQQLQQREQRQEQQRREQPRVREQLLLFYRKQPGQQQR